VGCWTNPGNFFISAVALSARCWCRRDKQRKHALRAQVLGDRVGSVAGDQPRDTNRYLKGEALQLKTAAQMESEGGREKRLRGRTPCPRNYQKVGHRRATLRGVTDRQQRGEKWCRRRGVATGGIVKDLLH